MTGRSQFTIYDKRTGEIVSTWTCPPADAQRLYMKQIRGDLANFARLADAVGDGAQQFVDPATGALIDKEPFDLTIAGNTVSGVPEGTEILLSRDNTRLTMDASGVLEIEVDYPATVTLRLRHPRHATTQIEVPCT